MTVRRFAIAVIAAAGVGTALIGAWVVGVALYPANGGFGWRVLLGALGAAVVVVGALCAWLVLHDLRPGRLSERATRWTWIATAVFALLALVSIWYSPLALVGPLATMLFVRLARTDGRIAPG